MSIFGDMTLLTLASYLPLRAISSLGLDVLSRLLLTAIQYYTIIVFNVK